MGSWFRRGQRHAVTLQASCKEFEFGAFGVQAQASASCAGPSMAALRKCGGQGSVGCLRVLRLQGLVSCKLRLLEALPGFGQGAQGSLHSQAPIKFQSLNPEILTLMFAGGEAGARASCRNDCA